MLSRARRIVRDAKEEPFQWVAYDATAAPRRRGRAGPLRRSRGRDPRTGRRARARRPARGGRRLDARRRARAPPQPAIDQEQVKHRLAELEREAFAKGYAAGERAGLEAGTTTGRRHAAAPGRDHRRARRPAAADHRPDREADGADRRGGGPPDPAPRSLDRPGSRRRHLRAWRSTGSARPRPPRSACTLTTTRPWPPGTADEWAGARVSVTADASVSRGGCRVESDLGFVDAGIDAQFDQLARALLGDAEASPVAAGGDDGQLAH